MLEFEPFYLTLKLAFTTTLILLVVGVPVSYWLAFGRSPLKVFAESVFALPQVLPPTVLGFYLLLALSPQNAFGRFLENYFDARLVFTFLGLVIASLIYSLPIQFQAF